MRRRCRSPLRCRGVSARLGRRRQGRQKRTCREKERSGKRCPLRVTINCRHCGNPSRSG
jgi:hypothetical protein